MRSSSESALAALRTDWERSLGEQPGSVITLAREAFALADFLSDERAVQRALTDPARSSEDRTALAHNLFAPKVSAPVLRLVEKLAQARWSDEADLVTSLEELGVQATLANADRASRLGDVEEELYRALRVLSDQRDLRVTLGDRVYDIRRREELARTVFAHVVPEALELIVRATQRAPEPTIAQSLNHYVALAAERGQHLVASVTVASPLTEEQYERLVRILTERYNTQVAVHVALDPDVIGGMRIHVGEDVIDATLASRINNVREAITR
ncbi:F0F1 ATP synthase subunit delta [Arcanobacterium haemolyticum]|nr:F0F1 ATP synthase subunit delta [Arcanobacterium haemolyticum]